MIAAQRGEAEIGLLLDRIGLHSDAQDRVQLLEQLLPWSGGGECRRQFQLDEIDRSAPVSAARARRKLHRTDLRQARRRVHKSQERIEKEPPAARRGDPRLPHAASGAGDRSARPARAQRHAGLRAGGARPGAAREQGKTLRAIVEEFNKRGVRFGQDTPCVPLRSGDPRPESQSAGRAGRRPDVHGLPHAATSSADFKSARTLVTSQI